MSEKAIYSKWAFVFAAVFLFAAAFWINKWTNPSRNLSYIKADVSGYYMYLPALFYDNLGEMHNQQYIIDNYHPCGDMLNQRLSPIGKYVIKYPSGMAIMYLPAFVAGHIWAKAAGYPADGFSYPYEFSLAMYSILFCLVGLWVCRKLLLLYFSDKVTAITLLALPLATNYLQYAAISNQLTHGYLFTIYSIIIYQTIKWHKTYRYLNGVVLGLLCGLATITRPTEIISVLIPFMWGVATIADVKARIATLWAQRYKVILLILAVILVGSIQLAYWKTYTGKLFYWSYEPDEELNLTKVFFYQCMFSYKKGWLVYTPFMWLAVFGFIPLYRKSRQLFFNSFVFVFIAFYLVFSWKCWWYGGSFSMRAVVQYYALMVLPLAAMFEYAVRRKLVAVLVVAFFLFCTWLNIVMHLQANVYGIMESNNNNSTYYWATFGKLHIDADVKKYIYTTEEIPKGLIEKLQTLNYRAEFCTDSANTSCDTIDGQQVFVMTKSVDFLPETNLPVTNKAGYWVRVTCTAFVDQQYRDYLSQPKLYAWLADGENKVFKANEYPIGHTAPWFDWKAYTLDIYIPSGGKAAILKTGILNNNGNIRVLVKDLKVEYAKPD
jgi:hypothetical protein